MSAAAAWQRNVRRLFAESPIAGPSATLIIVFILLSLFAPQFFTLRSVSGILNAATLTGVVTIGVTLLMISGEFDLSVGALVAAGGYLFAFSTRDGGSPLVGVLLALFIPAILGALNGLILIWTGIPSFIVTLGSQAIYRGAVWLFSGGMMVQTVEKLTAYNVLNGRLDVVNNLFQGANFRTATLWLVGVALIGQYALTRTRYGNHVFATGGNPGAARAQGVNVKLVKVVNFAVSGALSGFSGVLLFSQFQTVRVASGAGVELSAIAAAVVGGASLSGGYGSIWGALIGVLLISALRTGVILLNIPFIPADNFEAVVGVTIVAAVILNNWLRRRS
ncbi:MAG: ABC transporter permease [Chloroflexi bacterium]|nr:ABC transporter permease [Chloroflexota bacterium]